MKVLFNGRSCIQGSPQNGYFHDILSPRVRKEEAIYGCLAIGLCIFLCAGMGQHIRSIKEYEIYCGPKFWKLKCLGKLLLQQ